MITNFLMDNAALAPAALALTAAICVGVGYLLRRAHRLTWALAGLSTLPVIALTLIPTSSKAYDLCTVQFALPTLTRVELIANVALFFPLVFFTTLATHRPLMTLVAGTTLSATIETIQALVPAIGRACDTNDWAMNTVGSVAAVLAAKLTIALTKHSHSAPGH